MRRGYKNKWRDVIIEWDDVIFWVAWHHLLSGICVANVYVEGILWLIGVILMYTSRSHNKWYDVIIKWHDITFGVANVWQTCTARVFDDSFEYPEHILPAVVLGTLLLHTCTPTRTEGEFLRPSFKTRPGEREWEWERERECVCVCVRERERERERERDR